MLILIIRATVADVSNGSSSMSNYSLLGWSLVKDND